MATVLVGCLFLSSGFVDMGADSRRTEPLQTLIAAVTKRSIARRARGIDVPNLEDPLRIVAGADCYAARCATCHLTPGRSTSALRDGLNPQPPKLAEPVSVDTQRMFWIIKHGIRMSGMPAWRDTLSDAQIWDIIAFLQKLPFMSAEDYAQLLSSRPPTSRD